MKFQSLFSEESKKNTSKCHLLKFLPSMHSVKSLLFQCLNLEKFLLLYFPELFRQTNLNKVSK